MVQRKAAQLPENVRVVFEGRVDDVVPHIDWADLAIMPSRQELNPVFVWECWARGRAVIAPRIPAFVDLASKGPIRIYDNDSEMLERLSLEMVDDRARLAAFGVSDEINRKEGSRSAIVRFLTAQE
jgi:hypothetical protein